MQTIINELIAKGVIIPNPATLEIGPEVRLDRIKPGVTIHNGCRIFGAETLIEAGAVLGFEGPVTVNNCFIGPNVKLNGGFFEEAVFLTGVKAGSCSHVRAGTIMEEFSSIAHAVGLKQTILFPYVTLGSLINFCDCFMSGGTGPKNHSEVGSSYIHFNFTPSQHKATPSLLGDVPHGVMLNQRPIFLGGQGGMVGPCRFTFGVTTAAGIIVRKNEPHPDRLIFGYGDVQRTSAVNPLKGEQATINKQLIKSNIIYVANLVALRHWYRQIRSLFVGPHFSKELFDGLCLTLEKAIVERIMRMREYANAYFSEKDVSDLAWHNFTSVFDVSNIEFDFKDLCSEFKAKLKNNLLNAEFCDLVYLGVIKTLDAQTIDLGTGWLQMIVENVATHALKMFPN